MANLNLANGNHRANITVRDLAERESEIRSMWDAIINAMDDDTREHVADELAPCSEIEFLARYLELASNDLAIG